MAVAGFSRESIEIFEEDNKLTISGSRKEETTEDEELWHYNGLASRNFSRSFNLAPNVEITDVTLENGILVLRFHKDENKNRKMIEIR
jgi:molecular chaperone IbpA